MKKKLLLLSTFLLGSLGVMSQAINEGFEDINTLAGNGWVTNNLSSPIGTTGWMQANTSSPFVPNGGAGYIAANYNNVAGNSTISNWLITPDRTFQNGDIITFFSRTVDAPTYPDRLEVRMSTNGTSSNVGTTSTSVGDFTTVLLTINPTLSTTGYPSVWTQYTITISGLSAPTSGRVAFRYFVTNGGPSGTNSDFIGIDDFVYTPFGSASPDVTPISFVGEYTRIPISQVTPLTLEADISNVGTSGATDAMLTTNVYLSPNFTTPVQTTSSAPAALATGATATFNAGTYTPSAVGLYRIEHLASATGNGNIVNDTIIYEVEITDWTYGRDDNTVTASFGIGAGPTGYLGAVYTINSAIEADSVLVAFQKPGTDAFPGDGVGDSTRVVIFSTAAGVPSTMIGRSANYVFTPADTSVLTVKVFEVNDMAGNPLVLNPGTYYFGVTENQTNIGLAFSDDIFTNNTAFVSWPGQAWATLETFGPSFSKNPIVRPIFAPTCTLTASTSSTQSSCGAADGTATATGANGPAPYTYLWSNGQTTATATNLGAGTYTVVITDANGCTANASATVTNPNAPGGSITSQTDVSCNSGADGTATATATGGTAPYTYSWSPSGGTAATATGLAAGTYVVTITDAASCGTTVSVTITEPTAITASSSSTDEINGADGTATATATGGTAPYTYSWSPSGGTSATATGLAGGVYTCTITDANGCTSTTTVTVNSQVGLVENTLNGTISLYPNPTSDASVLDVQLNEETALYVELLSVTGQVVSSFEATGNNSISLDLSSYDAGVYYVHLTTATDGGATLKLIKK